MKPNLEINIGRLRLKNPVIMASGTFGCTEAFCRYFNPGALGAVVTKTITPLPRAGNRPPRITETTAGVLNAIGLANGGVDDFVENQLKKFACVKTKLIVSIGGDTQDDYVRIAEKLSGCERVEALEVNISCPNVTQGGQAVAQDERLTFELVKKVRAATPLPLIVKLSPNVTDITKIAKAAEEAGADAVSLINTLLGLAVDARTRRPVLGHITGGLSGPAIKPVALRMVWQARQAIRLPIIGMGGIMNGDDALEFMIAGASAVALGTANFVDPEACVKVVDGIAAYMSENKIENVNQLVGSLQCQAI